VETFEDYKRLCRGDEVIAAGFLAKAFTRTQIAEACEWCGVSIPDPILAGAEEAPPPAPQAEADNLPATW